MGLVMGLVDFLNQSYPNCKGEDSIYKPTIVWEGSEFYTHLYAVIIIHILYNF